jgi:uncharacterized protein (TIGR00288 family)
MFAKKAGVAVELSGTVNGPDHRPPAAGRPVTTETGGASALRSACICILGFSPNREIDHMAASADTASMALFCDFENVALGVRDAQYEKFDIRPVLERLLAKGSIVVKKAYCDWDRYKAFKAAMHEANFELIEIPHVRQSGKNSADIRMVVDALDLCYTKAHVDTFVIISGDSDFSPLVSKLRENAKRVIGVGVKQSCSDLLVTNCDEFIYYDDLVRDREAQRASGRRDRDNAKRSPEEEQRRSEKAEERKARAVELAAATLADLMADRGENDRVWASVLKEVMKRRNPGFNESYFGFKTFGNLLEEAAVRGLLAVGRDDKSGTYVTRIFGRSVESELPESGMVAVDAAESPESVPVAAGVTAEEAAPGKAARRRGGRRGRKETRTGEAGEDAAAIPEPQPAQPVPAEAPAGADLQPPVATDGGAVAGEAKAPRARRGGRRAAKAEAAVEPAVPAAPVAESPVEPIKPARRAPRSRKTKAAETGND